MVELADFSECREGKTGRALTHTAATVGGPNGMTVKACTTACQAAGYLLSGVEFSSQCCKYLSDIT